MLTSAQIHSYHEQGFVVVEDVLGESELREIRREADRIVETARGVTQDTEVLDLEDSHRPDEPRVRRIKEPHAISPLFAGVVRHPRIVAICTALLGEHVRLKTTKLNMKSGEFGAPVEWHQDWAFYPHTNDDLLAIGLMLDDVDDDNGPLLALPASHRGPTYDHHSKGVFCGAINMEAAGLDARHAVKMTGRAGSASVHHVRLVHGSDLNRSPRQRRVLFVEVAAADAWPLCGTTTRFRDLEQFDALMITGRSTTVPRMKDLPVRIPLPKHDLSSIYNAQKKADATFFSRHVEQGRAP